MHPPHMARVEHRTQSSPSPQPDPSPSSSTQQPQAGSSVSGRSWFGWQRAMELQSQLQALGLAGIVSYGQVA